ncbi:MAG: phosphoribosylformylglycinamidine synthase subunit PurL, partial [Verrucomicrobiota bacterium]
VKAVTDQIREKKPGFVVAAFDDNAGFIKLDENLAICLKAETHNHPSAIEPYAGANTGLGGVIRDILGAGKGAKPIANLDVFCFGPPDTKAEELRTDDVIHPLGIMRGVVRGVRDYGNRLGIPTVSGAIQFDQAFIYTPLVYCGTAGVIPIEDIPKTVEAGMKVVAVGGRTGRDGLKGATFSSMALDDASHQEDIQAVQIGNPIEEKKVSDFILDAREQGLIEFVTDCGAGGFSSAAGEMLSEIGGELYLENAPLKEEGLVSWEIFISESQERMVLAVKEESLPQLERLAEIYETEMCVLGQADGSGILKVRHNGELVCELDNSALHTAPRQHRTSEWTPPPTESAPSLDDLDLSQTLLEVLSDFAICSRAPVIREYDHEVQGNTYLKPLSGAKGDGPQDGAVMHVDGSSQLMAMSLSILPEWGKTDPNAMGAAVVDECVRQLVTVGADPDRIAILDNFCMGNPDDTRELGALVETCKGMAEAALAYQAPFVSGKDSFYNYFEVDGESISIPVTLLLSGMGIVECADHIIGSSITKADSILMLLGKSTADLGGSVLARKLRIGGQPVPKTNLEANLALYRNYYHAVKSGWIRSAHDVSEGGLLTTLAEMSFSEVAGVEVEIEQSPAELFAEAPGRILIEVDPVKVDQVLNHFGGDALKIGKTVANSGNLRVNKAIDLEIAKLKQAWKAPLAKYY